MWIIAGAPWYKWKLVSFNRKRPARTIRRHENDSQLYWRGYLMDRAMRVQDLQSELVTAQGSGYAACPTQPKDSHDDVHG